jgi:hypothetical protein
MKTRPKNFHFRFQSPLLIKRSYSSSIDHGPYWRDTFNHPITIGSVLAVFFGLVALIYGFGMTVLLTPDHMIIARISVITLYGLALIIGAIVCYCNTFCVIESNFENWCHSWVYFVGIEVKVDPDAKTVDVVDELLRLCPYWKFVMNWHYASHRYSVTFLDARDAMRYKLSRNT